ncbi:MULTISPECIES: hypothetical protein [Pseudomonas]|uniref:hypothetical protein n=1 Tax=Pseudomonas TaxID=286 RepID=UPI00165DACEE|nr:MULTISPECIES: hypothetical protein [Pseudomonas]
MDTKDRIALYEKLYFFELERKEKLISRLSLPLAIIVTLSSLLSTMLEKAPPYSDGMYGVLFWIFYLCCMITAVRSAWYFWRTWQLRDYDALLPDLSALEDHRQDLQRHFETHGESQDDAQAHFREIIIRFYVDCTTVNTRNNDKRAAYFSNMATNVALTFFLAMLSFGTLHLYQRGH